MSSPQKRPARLSAFAGNRDLAILAALLGLSFLGLVGLAAATGFKETLEALERLKAWQIGALLLLSLANYGLRGLRWHLFTRRLGLPTTLSQDLRHFIGGFAMSATPGRVGELVRMRWLRRETGWASERTAPLALVDRASDLAATAVILALSVALSAAGIAGALPVVIGSLAAAWVATHPRLLASLATLGHRVTGRFARLWARLRGAARSIAVFRSPGALMIAGALGIVGWMAEAVAFYVLLVWMGAEVDLATATAIFTFSMIAGGLTGAPGGVGGAEAAMIALLSLQGVDPAISIPATLIIRLTTLWFAIGLGLATFPVAEQISKRAANGN